MQLDRIVVNLMKIEIFKELYIQNLAVLRDFKKNFLSAAYERPRINENSNVQGCPISIVT